MINSKTSNNNNLIKKYNFDVIQNEFKKAAKNLKFE